MLAREAAWLGTHLARFTPEEFGTVLSIGSGSEEFRTRRQPWIEREIFAPLRRRSIPVLHHEFQAAPGVDIVGDLTDVEFLRSLAVHRPGTLLVLNVLEHLDDPETLIRESVALLPGGGLMVVSVPHRFPYHPDPLDTMLRPSADELTGLMVGLEPLFVAEVRAESYLAYALTVPDKLAAARRVLSRSRTPAPPVRPAAPPPAVPIRDRLSMALVSTSVACGIYRKPAVTTDITA